MSDIERHLSPISGIASSRHYVATAGYDNKVILWDAKSHVPLKAVWHEHLANQCEFSPCEKYLVSASSDYSVKLWSLPELHLVCTFQGHEDDVEMATFHPNKRMIATASRDYKVRVFNYFGNVLHILEGHTSDVISVSWGKRDHELISSSDDGTVRIWNLENETYLVIDLGEIEVDSVVACSDSLIYAGNDAGEIIQIRGKEILREKFFKAGIKRMIFDKKQNKLLALSYDRTLKIFDKREKGHLQISHEASLPDIVWPRSATIYKNEILFASFGDSYAIYNPQNKEWKISHIGSTIGINAVITYRGDLYTIGDAGILKKNDQIVRNLKTLCNFLCVAENTLFTGGQNGTIYNAFTGEKSYQLSSPINAMTSWEKNGQHFCAVATYIGKIEIFKVTNGGLIFNKSIKVLNNAVKGICNNGKVIFAVGAAGDASIISLEKNYHVKPLGIVHSKIANGCAFVRDDVFVSISRDLKIRFFRENKKALSFPTPHDHSIKSICVDSSGRYIATGSYYGRIGVFDYKNKKWIQFYRLCSSGISCIFYSQTKRCFILGSYNGKVYFVNPETKKLNTFNLSDQFVNHELQK